jgi:hypothetical protein
MCVAELTSQVACKLKVTRKNMPHIRYDRPAAECQQRYSNENERQPIQAIEPNVKSVLYQIRGTVCHDRVVILLGRTAQNLSHV